MSGDGHTDGVYLSMTLVPVLNLPFPRPQAPDIPAEATYRTTRGDSTLPAKFQIHCLSQHTPQRYVPHYPLFPAHILQ